MLIKLLVVMGGAVAGLIFAVTLALFQGGIATVYVESPEATVFVPVPMVLVDVALAFAPSEELADARRELEPYRDVIKVVLEELANCPDAIFVEVEGPEETVLVEKKGSDLHVEVHSFGDSTHVNVRVPLRSVRRVVASVAG